MLKQFKNRFSIRYLELSSQRPSIERRRSILRLCVEPLNRNHYVSCTGRCTVTDCGKYFTVDKQNQCLFHMACVFKPILSSLSTGEDMGYPVSDLLHDVQRPISDQRSLRHGACSEQQKTRASQRQIRVRGLQ